VYAALWRVLPGPWWLRTLLLVFAATVLVIALVMFVFPWVDQQFFAPADPVIGGEELPGEGGDPAPPGDGPSEGEDGGEDLAG